MKNSNKFSEEMDLNELGTTLAKGFVIILFIIL